MPGWAPPGGAELREVLPSMAAALGVRGCDDTLGIGSAQRAVVLLVDGLGEVPLRRAVQGRRASVPTLEPALGRSLRAPFPSTTPTGLAALGTGLDAGCHGVVGASFLLPETGRVLWPLAWKEEPLPVMVQPEPTVLERAAAEGVRVTSVSPRQFEASGLTRAALRGGEYSGADSFGERVGGVVRSLDADGPALTYVYWGDLDKTGHVHGTASTDWNRELELVDLLVRRLLDALPSGTVLAVTADHGMLDTVGADRVALDDLPELREHVVHLAGEPRVRHVYTRPGAACEVAATWRSALGERAMVLLRDEAVQAGWFGEVDPALEDRIGDVVAVAEGTCVLASESVDSRTSALVGQHGALTQDELAVPLLTWRA